MKQTNHQRQLQVPTYGWLKKPMIDQVCNSVTMALAFIYLSKKTLPDDQDAQSVYGLELDDEDLPAPQLSA